MDNATIVERVKAAIDLRLDEGGYIDGYSYCSNEWALKIVWYHAKSNCYYAWIEVDSIRAPREALYEIDANDEDWGTDEGELASHVGRWEIERPDDCLELWICPLLKELRG